MPILQPLKVPERGNAITQRKTLEIEHSCLNWLKSCTRPGTMGQCRLFLKHVQCKATPQLTKHVCLYFIHRTTQPGHYRFFLIPPKNPYSNHPTQRNTCQIFVPKKLLESKISNPKKSFDHPHHLKSRVPPLGWGEVFKKIQWLYRNGN